MELIDVNKVKEGALTPNSEKHDRLTVVFQAAHDHCCSNPVAVDCRFGEILKNVEQAWVRQIKVKQEPRPLDFGWLADVGVGYFIIENNTLLRDKEDKTDCGDLIVGHNGCGWVVPPGRFFFGLPYNTQSINVYSLGKEVDATLTAFPA